MKKLLTLFILFTAFKAGAQNSVLFKLLYLPNHTYNAVVSTKATSNISLSGDTTVTNKLKAQGMTQPVSINVNNKISSTIITGPRAANENFPFTISYQMGEIDLKVNGKDMAPPPGGNTRVLIYGYVNRDGKVRADSLKGGTMKDTSQKMLTQLVNSIQSQIKFPDHDMKVGDTFTQDMPINLPVAGNNVAATVKVIYKLTRIADGNAYFDVDQSMTMQINIAKALVNLNGTGNGTMVFNIKNSFPTDFKTTLNLKFDGKLDKLGIDGTAQVASDYTYVITE